MAKFVQSKEKVVKHGDVVDISIPPVIAHVKFDVRCKGHYLVVVNEDGSYTVMKMN